jgi:Rieske Fe-S protein
MLVTDMVMGRDNPWAELYDPDRVRLLSATELSKENLNVSLQYADLVMPGEVSSVDEIPPGEGRILRRGLHPIAAYREEDGTLHELSAICKHLGCVVRWNSLERTWDCPCHGSRYDSLGRVVNAPSPADLDLAEG